MKPARHLVDMMKAQSDANRSKITEYYQTHVGCHAHECALALDINPHTVHRHIKEIRKEWRR